MPLIGRQKVKHTVSNELYFPLSTFDVTASDYFFSTICKYPAESAPESTLAHLHFRQHCKLIEKRPPLGSLRLIQLSCSVSVSNIVSLKERFSNEYSLL
jgi:hypothetical protein